jgi:hypothetical protein
MNHTNLIGCAAMSVMLALGVSVFTVQASQLFEVKTPPAIVTNSRSCSSGTPAQKLESRVPVAAWILGAREGAFVSWTKQVLEGEAMRSKPGMEAWIATARAQASSASASADRMAASLKVPRVTFTPPRGEIAFDALYRFVEGEMQPTARGLALGHASWICEVYKLGVYWGFSMPYRIGVREMPNVLSQEINYYAARVALPPELTQRMIRGVSRSLDDKQVFNEGEELSRTIAEYWLKR